jgi:quercetin dioxygenase-like cupin family protein
VKALLRRQLRVYGDGVTTGASGSSRRIGAGMVLALALLLTGCGGSSDGAVSSTAAAPAPSGGDAKVLLDSQELDVLGRPIAYPTKKPAQVSSSVITLEPGQETGWHKNKAPMFAYVLDGTVTVEYDAGVIKEYPAGTSLMEAQGVWHNGTNKGDQTVHVLVVSFGAKGVKNTVQRAN